jgi:hypothetical protein
MHRMVEVLGRPALMVALERLRRSSPASYPFGVDE